MKMSNFKVYAEKLHINENKFMELIQLPRFFMGGYVAQADEIVIHDEQDAIDYATDQDVDLHKGSEYRYWTEIQEMNDRGAGYDQTKRLQLGNDFDHLLSNTSKKITNALIRRGEKEKVPSPLIDWACTDFYLFLSNMTLFVEQSRFHRALYRAYENGGIPCGWKGNFPAGYLLVYSKI
jgi:hypothetical protein